MRFILLHFRRFTYVTAHSPTLRRFTYVTAHSPTPPSLHLRHSSFSNPSVASPTPQLILNPSVAVPTSQALHLRQLARRPCPDSVSSTTKPTWSNRDANSGPQRREALARRGRPYQKYFKMIIFLQVEVVWMGYYRHAKNSTLQIAALIQNKFFSLDKTS